MQFQQLLLWGRMGGGMYEPEALNTKNIKDEEEEDLLRSTPLVGQLGATTNGVQVKTSVCDAPF